MVQKPLPAAPAPLSTLEMLAIERRRLLRGLVENEDSVAFGTWSYVVRCDGNANLVLKHAKELLLTVNDEDVIRQWPSDEEWRRRLPDWFLAACGPSLTAKEAVRQSKRLKKLTRKQRIEWSKQYKIPADDWLYWMRPGGAPGFEADQLRLWYWRDARVVDADTMETTCDIVEMVVTFPAYEWLFRSAGAVAVDAA